jgi:spore germination cell wall hydrolase CwlJ-like protein
MRALGRISAAGILALLAIATQGAAADERDVDAEIACLALTIYYEARGESEQGKLAVGQVVMNRTRSTRFPASICDVVQEGGERRHQCQFSWWCDGLSDRPRDKPALRESLRLAQVIYHGCMPDPTRGALWYHSTAVNPAWSRTSGPGKKIGRHVFYRGASGTKTTSATRVRWTDRDRNSGAACRAPAPNRTSKLLAAG